MPLQQNSFRTVLLFALFLVSNALLSYAPLGVAFKLWIGVLGLLIPLTLALRLPAFTDVKKEWSQEKEGEVRLPTGIVVAWILATLFVRFYRLDSLTVWPMWDDAYNAYFSILQMQDWHRNFYYISQNIAPLYCWSEGIFFRFVGPSLHSLWLFPAILSCLTCGVGYWAARQFFSGFSAFLYGLVLSFCFWALYLGRYNLVGMGPLSEFITLGLLGIFLRHRQDHGRNSLALILGLSVGIGFYAWILSLVVAPLVSLVVFVESWSRKPKAWKPFLCYFLPVLFLFLPMTGPLFETLFRGYIHEHLTTAGPDWNHPLQRLRVILSYPAALLWGTLEPGFNFGPFWGGLFNPILGSLLLLGGTQVWRTKGKIFFLAVASLFFILLLPGLVSRTVEIMRIVAVLPFCIALVALGWKALLQSFIPAARISVLAATLLGSVTLDAYHLLGPYHRWSVPGLQSGPSKSLERYRAFVDLQPKVQQQGPGALLSELVLDVYDQSLFATTYPFNAAVNPALSPNQVHWTAFFINARYQAYLKNRFPDCQVFSLSEGLPRTEGPLVLVWVPRTPSSDRLLQRCLLANQSLKDFYILLPFQSGKGSFGPAREALQNLRPFFKGEPFLESCYWDKMAAMQEWDEQLDQARQSCLQGVKACSSQPLFSLQCGHFWQKLANEDEYYFKDKTRAILDLRHVIQEKYHPAQAYRQLAGLLAQMGKRKDAEAAAQKAATLESRITP